MSEAHPISRRTGAKLAWRLITSAVGALACAGMLVLVYALVPVPVDAWAIGTFTVYVVVCLFVFTFVTVMALIRLSKARRPLFEGLTFVAIMASILVLSYSWLYLVMSVSDPTAFTEQLSKVSAVYFTVTVLATVGFGDITPTGDISRLVVTSQMLLGFTVITIAIKTVLSSTTSAVKKRGTNTWLEKHHDEALKQANADVARATSALAQAQDRLTALQEPDPSQPPPPATAPSAGPAPDSPSKG